MLSPSPAGFSGAPITRTLVIGTAILSTASSVLDVRHLFSLDLFGEGWSWWRLGVWEVGGGYGDVGGMVVGSLAMYNLREVERFYGSDKFLSIVLGTWASTSVAVPVVARALAALTGAAACGNIPQGPLPIVFALLAHYVAVIPPTYTVTLARTSTTGAVQVSDKVYMGALAIGMATARMPGSLVCAVVGWMVGVAYTRAGTTGTGWWSKVVGWRLPRWLSGLVIDHRPVNVVVRAREEESRNVGGGAGASRGAGGRRSGGIGDVLGALASTGDVPRPDLQPPSDTDVQTLSAMMGITPEEAVRHLQHANNSLERAAENLLAGL
ncbi:hypothetical protein PYCC9005_001854 [Savitreella phatthalungensis]